MRFPDPLRLAGAGPLGGALLVAVAGVLAGCSKQAAAPAAPPPKLVTTVTTEARTLPATSQHVGRVSAFAKVEIRSRVQGIIRRSAFTPGTDVTKDQLLFEIEDDYYRAAAVEAQAQLSRAEAERVRAADYERRLAALVGSEAISRQDYENAVTLARQAAAAELAARAAVERAMLDLPNTRVVATEDGRIGRAQVSAGSLVGREGPTHLATIEKIDPIFVLFTIADNEGLAIRRAMAAGTIAANDERGRVAITLGDGTRFEQKGRIDFAAAQVTPDTGTVTLRAVVDNPRKELLPGMFVRLELALGERPNAIAIPQQAVIKTPTGHVAWVVVDGKAQRRDLVVGPWVGHDWLIEKGLGAGEVVVVDGAAGLVSGAPVQVVPAPAS
jgi:membrane fusion protein (multidrug efflux system)